jgi:hypothetical protein
MWGYVRGAIDMKGELSQSNFIRITAIRAGVLSVGGIALISCLLIFIISRSSPMKLAF